MDCPNTAQRLWQTWDGGDGKTWIDVPCGTTAGHITYLCFGCKVGGGHFTMDVPDRHKSHQPLQAELRRDIYESARRNGTDLQKA